MAARAEARPALHRPLSPRTSFRRAVPRRSAKVRPSADRVDRIHRIDQIDPFSSADNGSPKIFSAPGAPEPGGEALIVVGGRRLSGTVAVSGSKNASLALLAGALLTRRRVALRGVPDIGDVRQMLALVESLGAAWEWRGGCLQVCAAGLGARSRPHPVDDAAARSLRASFIAVGPLLARTGVARMPLPGGCAIGPRPVDITLAGMRALGARVAVDHDSGWVEARCDGRLRGGNVALRLPSVGATQAVMMAGALADGRTVISNAAREPEVVDLAGMMRKMGARISGPGSREVVVDGVGELGGASASVRADRIEAGTLMAAGAITGSGIRLLGIEPENVAATAGLLERMGCGVARGEAGGLAVVPGGELLGADVVARPHPGFPTDLQPVFAPVMAAARGRSSVRDAVFEGRWAHAEQLRRMGARISVRGDTATVVGRPPLGGRPQLKGAHLEASDLRAAAGLVVAALAAEGLSIIHNLHHLDRGYDGLDRKLASLGAEVYRSAEWAALQPGSTESTVQPGL
ncbi:unnamed protein product [Ostreobium quekettii]|uniref:UDP-N-acetylglucosamine 1-carboxyvinyltransferase n=1 Tax=Ostreobium quekettii TaxID=121088 RepID=A0A8S1IYA1_9CHLO|nr:unnamed protein product [Ostreobium quekettii]|eukprot:evm.model.scf_115EXC.10 EVM.evm.TU.scf_115EXC.10   scf_115EXC:116757-120810(-)